GGCSLCRMRSPRRRRIKMANKGKADQSPLNTPAAVECCPQLEPCQVCDVLNFTYRLPFRPLVAAGDQRQVVPVEVTLHYRLTRCSGPLSLGDLLYTTTLLPGEQVRLFRAIAIPGSASTARRTSRITTRRLPRSHTMRRAWLMA